MGKDLPDHHGRIHTMTEATHHAGGEPAASADRSSAHCSECHHPTRRRPSMAVLVAFVAGSVLSGLTAAVAATTFTDVTEANPFKADIDWAAANGVTEGYPDGTFKPSKAVTRAQMVAFLHRYNNATVTVSNHAEPGAVTFYTLNATCPSGTRVIAGGGYTFDNNFAVAASAPFNSTTWTVRWVSKTGAALVPLSLTTSATCAPAL
jgi:hypothetical protein